MTGDCCQKVDVRWQDELNQLEKSMRDFKKLKVWEKSHKLVLEIYDLTKNYPHDEFFGLSSQIRRAVTSVPTNIAEGCGRESIKELIRCITIAKGSATELEYLIFLSYELNLINSEKFTEINKKIIEVKKMLSGYAKKMSESADH